MVAYAYTCEDASYQPQYSIANQLQSIPKSRLQKHFIWRQPVILGGVAVRMIIPFPLGGQRLLPAAIAICRDSRRRIYNLVCPTVACFHSFPKLCKLLFLFQMKPFVYPLMFALFHAGHQGRPVPHNCRWGVNRHCRYEARIFQLNWT